MSDHITEPSRLVVLDDTHPRIRYSGAGWNLTNGDLRNTTGTFSKAFQKTLHVTNTQSTLSLTFAGNFAEIYGTADFILDPTGSQRGLEWRCILDGSESTKAKQAQPKVPTNDFCCCRYENLDNDEHTIQLEVLDTRGATFGFDKIVYRPIELVEKETILVLRDDADIERAGAWTTIGSPLAGSEGYSTSQPGSNFTFSFVGTGVSMVSTLPAADFPATGTYRVDDGKSSEFTIPIHISDLNTGQSEVFRTPKLKRGPHKITVSYQTTPEQGRRMAPLSFSYLLIHDGSNERVDRDKLGDTGRGVSKGVVIGSVLGGFALLLAVFAAFYFRKKAQVRSDPEKRAEPTTRPYDIYAYGNNEDDGSAGNTYYLKSDRSRSNSPQNHSPRMDHLASNVVLAKNRSATSQTSTLIDTGRNRQPDVDTSPRPTVIDHQDSGITLPQPEVIENPPSYDTLWPSRRSPATLAPTPNPTVSHKNHG
ncbi:hypothetical protein CC1G_09893 [Coprinopsis cinerea okayama7|uniref:Uncharacterized protein n=1 Tax=Coprinopsis cinerea (strain Okayama-7 / 130 / ATCC MYA-4618 / FGSC 9003) TaxID=240176 RepID=A8N8N4_COPC7|nr:hypothetical protein CC1G_09893 [Coprinopsis cinerea okayama7\|eukprot:XP_001831190.2 hypothetical protein CC1G_09893 [Coprinopsis cinerea okayama7\